MVEGGRRTHGVSALLLVTGCEGPLVYLCDTEADTVAGTLRVHSDVSRDDDVTIDVLRYTPHGRHLAVATSDAHIRLYDPDLCALVFCIGEQTAFCFGDCKLREQNLDLAVQDDVPNLGFQQTFPVVYLAA